MKNISLIHIDELLRLLPVFLETDKFIEENGGGEKLDENTISAPFVIYTKDVNEFINLVQNCWTDFNYFKNIDRDNIYDDDFVQKSNIIDIKSMLTYIIRNERFCDGCLEEYFRDNRINLILKRLLVLREKIVNNNSEIQEILNDAKLLANKYKNLTNKPLGITGEIAEFVVSQKLNLILAGARQKGFDAFQIIGNSVVRVQIKGRSLLDNKISGRLGRIRLDTEWDKVMLAILNEKLDLQSIYEANRASIENVLSDTNSKSSQRGSLSISKFISIGSKIY